MVGFQDKICYNKGEEIAPIDKVKAELIEKIKQLPNEECKRIICKLNAKKKG